MVIPLLNYIVGSTKYKTTAAAASQLESEVGKHGDYWS